MITYIGDREYPSKAAAVAAVQEVLWRLPARAAFSSGADFDLLIDLVAMHPESAQKIGDGVRSFSIEQAGRGRCFWLTRLNGSRTDWSYLACLTPPTHRSDAMAALRHAVQGQIETFRDRAVRCQSLPDGRVECALTGERILVSECHVDHVEPFRGLVAAWMRQLELRWADLRVLPTTDGSTVAELADDGQLLSWRRYHIDHATLRIVSARANLARPRGAR